MILEQVGEIPLPAHHGSGGFDHAAVHRPRRQLYVAHTANNVLDVIDCAAGKYLRSVPYLEAVAGALVSEEHDLVFTSNRGENTVGLFSADHEEALAKVSVGVKPNGLAYDPARGLLLAANVGDPSLPGSFTVSVVDVSARAMIADVPVPGRTRWTVFDAEAGCFYVNIAHPAQIAVIESANPSRVARTFRRRRATRAGPGCGHPPAVLRVRRRRACRARFEVGRRASAGRARRCPRCHLLQPDPAASLCRDRRPGADRSVRDGRNAPCRGDSDGDGRPHARIRPDAPYHLCIPAGLPSGACLSRPRLNRTTH